MGSRETAGEAAVTALAEGAPVRAFLIVSLRSFREPLARALGRVGIEVVGTASDSSSALPCIAELEPDVALLEAARQEQRWAVAGLKAAAPGLRIVALGVPDYPADAVAVVEAGASGYVTSDQSIEETAAVLRSVARGEFPCSGRVAAILADRLVQLSPAGPAREPPPARLTAREHEIAGLMSAGLTNKEIAQLLYIELATVKNHVHSILAKLGVPRRSDVASRVSRSVPLWQADPVGLSGSETV